MKKSQKFTYLIILLIIFLTLMGCAQQFKMISPPIEAPIMKYIMPENEMLTYRIESDFLEKMKVQGKKVTNITQKEMIVSFKTVEKDEDVYLLKGKLQFVAIKFSNTYIGEDWADTKNLQKKTFLMTLDEYGDEGELVGNDDLIYNINRIGEQSLAPDFVDFFPDLPGRPLHVGESWTETDTLDLSDHGVHTQLVNKNKNKLAGYALIRDHECAMIKVEYLGLLKSINYSEGEEYITTAEIKGTYTCFFDYQRGQFVRMISEGEGKGESVPQGRMQGTVPLTQEYYLEVNLDD